MRARNIKPGLFKNELLGKADPILTVLFAGLWCMADREGRVEDRPERIRVELFPYRAEMCIDSALKCLADMGLVHRYTSGRHKVVQITGFLKHQKPHKNEIPSSLPPPRKNSRLTRTKERPRDESLAPKSVPLGLIPSSLNASLLNPSSLNPESGSPLRAAAPLPEPEPEPGTVLKNGFGGEDRAPEIRADGPARPVGEILAGMKQRFRRA